MTARSRASLTAATPEPEQSATPPPRSARPVAPFADCAEALAAGRSLIPSTDPQFSERLDRDGDGVGCDRRGDPPTATTEPAPGTAAREPDSPPAEPSPAEPQPAVCPTELAGTLPHVARAGHHLAQGFGIPLTAIGGRAGRARASDHPLGLALDFTVDRVTGDALADYMLAHRAELGVTYVIYRQRIDAGSGWQPMEDRGSPTANHMDHVHVSFGPNPGPGLPC